MTNPADLSLRPSLFWDIDVTKLDAQRHRQFIIERTLMRGMKEEFDLVLQFYGRDAVREAALAARYLDERTLAFCCAIFDIPKTELRCFKLAQLMPAL